MKSVTSVRHTDESFSRIMPSYDLNVTTYMLSKFFKPVTSQIRGDLPNPFFLLKSYEINKAFFQAIFDLI